MPYLVNKVLLGGSGITAFNITYQGIDTSFGFFNGKASNIGMDSGIIITNGTLTLAGGPNMKTYGNGDGAYTTYNFGNIPEGWPNARRYNDSDLAALVNVAYKNTFSSALLQFDFTANSDSIQFDYSFGSNEWPAFFGSTFTDDFGFFLSGPGIAGPFTRGAINLATLPGTTTPVAINNVFCTTNSAYYVCNDTTGVCTSNCPVSLSTTTVGYNGFTTVLTAKAKVQCGKTYHIKLGVADIGDQTFDSGVFLKGGSFKLGASTMLAAASSTSTCPGSPVTLSATNATTYAWSPAVSLNKTSGDSVIATPTITTTYTVIGNAGGCGDSTTVVINVDTLTPPVITFKDSICSGGSTVVTATGNGLTYLWNTGATTSTITVSNITANVYDTLKATNSCGQDSVMPFVIHYVAPVVPSTHVVFDTLCLGSSTQITASGSSGYIWSTGATTATILVTPTKDSVYTVTTTNACPGSAKDTVHVVNSITISVSGPASTCPGNAVTLIASGAIGGTTYNWSPANSLSSSTGTSVTATPTVTTGYNVYAWSGVCTATAYHIVAVDTLTKPIITFTDSICTGTSTTITATAATSGKMTYVWSTGATTSSITTPTLTTTTGYTVTATDSCGQSAAIPITVNVVQITYPTVTPSPDTICSGGSVNLHATGASGYIWAPASSLNKTTGANVRATPTVQTIYTITATDKCPGSVTDTISIHPPVVAVISGPDSICPGGTVVLTATGGNTYVWSTGQTGSTISITPSATSTYSVSAHVGNCRGRDTTTVTVTAPLTFTITASPNPICPNTASVLTATGGLNYTWNTGATGSNITVTPSTTTTYSINGTTAAGCIGSGTLVENVTTVIQPVISGVNPVCQNDSITLTVTGGNGTAYMWNTGASTSSITFIASASGNYKVWNTGGCADTSNTFPLVVTKTTPLITCCDTTIALGSSAHIGASGAVSYSWTPVSNVNCFTCANTTATPTTSTTYTVVGTDANGCKVTGTVIVLIECKDFSVPNVFTPNGDGQNDVFLIKAATETSYTIEIRDRWGVLVYKSSDPTSAWNGKINNTGAEAPDGVYYYIIVSKCSNNDYNHHGYVEVIRK